MLTLVKYSALEKKNQLHGIVFLGVTQKQPLSVTQSNDRSLSDTQSALYRRVSQSNGRSFSNDRRVWRKATTTPLSETVLQP